MEEDKQKNQAAMTKGLINARHGGLSAGAQDRAVGSQPDHSVKGKEGFSVGGEVRAKLKRIGLH